MESMFTAVGILSWIFSSLHVKICATCFAAADRERKEREGNKNHSHTLIGCSYRQKLHQQTLTSYCLPQSVHTGLLIIHPSTAIAPPPSSAASSTETLRCSRQSRSSSRGRVRNLKSGASECKQQHAEQLKRAINSELAQGRELAKAEMESESFAYGIKIASDSRGLVLPRRIFTSAAQSGPIGRSTSLSHLNSLKSCPARRDVMTWKHREQPMPTWFSFRWVWKRAGWDEQSPNCWNVWLVPAGHRTTVRQTHTGHNSIFLLNTSSH